MTRWIQYISLFDFSINHVPATSHKGPDGLSRRGRAEDDSDDSDAEDFLDRFEGAHAAPSFSLLSYINAVSAEALGDPLSIPTGSEYFKDL
ncbi:hypothetical protein H0H92_001087, partial [Tricholoma furcatifolium]